MRPYVYVCVCVLEEGLKVRLCTYVSVFVCMCAHSCVCESV